MRGGVVAVAVTLAVWSPSLSAEALAAGPRPKTIEAWNAYVAASRNFASWNQIAVRLQQVERLRRAC